MLFVGRLKQGPKATPGKPVAYNSGLLWLIYGLLYGIVACCFRLLGFSGTILFGCLDHQGHLSRAVSV